MWILFGRHLASQWLWARSFTFWANGRRAPGDLKWSDLAEQPETDGWIRSLPNRTHWFNHLCCCWRKGKNIVANNRCGVRWILYGREEVCHLPSLCFNFPPGSKRFAGWWDVLEKCSLKSTSFYSFSSGQKSVLLWKVRRTKKRDNFLSWHCDTPINNQVFWITSVPWSLHASTFITFGWKTPRLVRVARCM